MRAALVYIDGPAAASLPPGRHHLKGTIPQCQKIVEEGRADIGLGTMIVPLKMLQVPPLGFRLVRLPLNGANEHIFPIIVIGGIFSGNIVCRLRDAPPT